MTIKKAEKAKRKKAKSSQRDLEFRELSAILGNPTIFSAMAMAMSIYGALCVLVHFQSFLFPLKISLLEMLIALNNEHLKK